MTLRLVPPPAPITAEDRYRAILDMRALEARIAADPEGWRIERAARRKSRPRRPRRTPRARRSPAPPTPQSRTARPVVPFLTAGRLVDNPTATSADKETHAQDE